ncbi:MAG: hypothetical protein JSU00_00245 [Acidobacteria bacterium]|nr:hypothetical protein [Acidobacteriota bacterium]
MRALTALFALAGWPAAAAIVAVSSANYQTPVAPASLVTLFGSNPATSTATAQLDSAGQLPTVLAGVTVQAGGQAAQLLYVSPTQINLVMPASIASGTVEIVVTGPNSTASATVEVKNAAPALFSSDFSGGGPGAILNGVTYAGGPFTIETTANLGDDKRTRLSIYGTGIRYAGNPFLDSTITNAAAAVTAQALDSAGNVYTLPVEYAGAAPLYFGLDQVNVVLPPQLDGLGTLSLTISTTTASSNVVTFAVDSLPVSQIRLLGFGLDQSSVLAGGSVSGTVTLNAPARSGGLTVTLASSAVFAQIPASVTVPGASIGSSFTVTTSSNGSGSATLTASANGVARTALLTVNSTTAPTLSGLTLSATPVVGGNSVTGTVTLGSAAPSGGAVVALSTDAQYAQTPASVTIGGGQSSATFTITTTAVTSAQAVTVSASYNGTSKTAVLTVNPLFTLALANDSVTGGQSTAATVTLGAASTGASVVNFASSDLSAATVPSFITIAAGQTSGSATVSTSAVATSRTVTITATYKATPLKASLIVLPAGSATVSSVTLSPATVKGGVSLTGTVTLSAAAPLPSGATVTLASSNKLVAQVPASVTVSGGQTSAKFTITTTAVSSTQTVTISATSGGITRGASLTVQ